MKFALLPREEYLVFTVDSRIVFPPSFMGLTMFGLFGRSRQKRRDAALLRAVYEGDLEAVRRALDEGASPDARRDDGQTALMRAASEGDRRVVEELLAAGATVGVQSETGETALHLIVQPHFDQSLQEAEVDAQVRAELGAAEDGMEVDQALVQIARRLLAAGALPDQGDRHGTTPLLRTAFEGRADIAELLLQGGADPNLENHQGLMPLLGACHTGDTVLLQALLAAGAQVNNAANVDGLTGLMVAAGQGHAGVVRILLAAGAAVDARSRDGRSALELAQRAEHAAVIRLLEKAEVKPAGAGDVSAGR